MLEDRQGHLWFATAGGVSRYDGQVFQTLTRRDGLVFDVAQVLLQDRSGTLWIGTEGGLIRYRSAAKPPAVRLRAVLADRRYEPTGALQIPGAQRLMVFEFQGSSLTTHAEGMAYVYRLEGYQAHWQPTYRSRVEYHDLSLGEYTFQVKAVDRDLNYSEPVTVRVTIEPDPRLEALTRALSAGGPASEFVGESPALRQVQQQLAQVAPTDVNVLILGETGTGKGLAARLVHRLSPRQDQPFIQVNCGALPAGLVESELFGHEKGAFTSAVARQLGKVELAQGGTLFLDEIGDLPLDAQVKLLHLLEERTFERVGGRQTLAADVRVVAATNRDLPQRIAAGTFRADLYYRLQGFEVRLPPLRQRREDIALLALYFMTRVAAHLDKDVTALSPPALAALQRYDWPGNVRELQHAVERAVVVCQGTAIRPEELPLEGQNAGPGHRELRLSPEDYERYYVQQLLEETGWVLKGPHGVAARLGWPVVTLRRRLKKWGITRP
jgi:DNA-binding NtrC family response regulator